MQIMFTEEGVPMPKPFADTGPLATIMVFDQTDLSLVSFLLSYFIRQFKEPCEFSKQLEAVQRRVDSNIPEVTQ